MVSVMIENDSVQGVELKIAPHEIGVSSPMSDTALTPTDFELENGRAVEYRRVSFETVKERVNIRYDVDPPRRYSSAIDALASFVKGKKHMHHESQRHAMIRLQILMIPALIASAIQPILIQADSIQCTEEGKIIVGTLAALATCLIGTVSMLRLDACVEAHRSAEHQYDKLQSLLEFQSGQVLLFSDPSLKRGRRAIEVRKGLADVETIERINSLSEDDNELSSEKIKIQKGVKERLSILRKQSKIAEDALTAKMKDLVQEVDTKIRDIKDSTKFPIPSEILCRYPFTSNTNIFSLIKRIDDARTKTITDLTYVINCLRHERVLREQGTGTDRYKDLCKRRRTLCDSIIYLNTAYSIVDEMFAAERAQYCKKPGCQPIQQRSIPDGIRAELHRWIFEGKGLALGKAAKLDV